MKNKTPHEIQSSEQQASHMDTFNHKRQIQNKNFHNRLKPTSKLPIMQVGTTDCKRTAAHSVFFFFITKVLVIKAQRFLAHLCL